MRTEYGEKMRKADYAFVRDTRRDLYDRAVEIGHLPIFEPNSDAAASAVEESVMGLIADLLRKP